ncbi:RT0821/Lpp0805 family surface protein [Paraburkholderia oxyphila]|uniref:RT0821/Lpp0805 family surface protein n=1 Tax=Paraburkholderia oxyphila TaxID=614212 RepID=UPI00069334A7|nr:RT0821/Lpp0805 family surface protein [Paraburkholderia oxyphila]
MNKATAGSLIGAGTGATLGGLFSHGSAGGIVAGGLIGGLLGGVIGHEMDERDREAREQALQQALQTSKNNQTRHWHNAKTGNSGSIKPLNGYSASASAQTCRQFTETYVKEGKTYEQNARACRNSNGEWQLAEQ